MLYRCELWNSHGEKGEWIQVELIGDNYLDAFFRRFGNINSYRVRNFEQFNPETGDWEAIE